MEWRGYLELIGMEMAMETTFYGLQKIIQQYIFFTESEALDYNWRINTWILCGACNCGPSNPTPK